MISRSIFFYQGKNSEGYKFFGVHAIEENGVKKHRFRVWAPNAVSISVVGDFNEWNRSAAIPMVLIADGVWEASFPDCSSSMPTSTASRHKKADF